MFKKAIVVALMALIAILVFRTFSSEESVEAYNARIESTRVEKNEFMRDSDQSPFAHNREAFEELKYYPANLKYKVKAKIERFESRSYTDLAVSTGESEKYLKYAYASFEIEGQPLRLLLLKKLGSKTGTIFTAFADNTSGNETYGSGRYLDLEFKNAKSIEIDFNLAYNPYCVYDDKFSCPFPPKENILPIHIEAGEKLYHEY